MCCAFTQTNAVGSVLTILQRPTQEMIRRRSWPYNFIGKWRTDRLAALLKLALSALMLCPVRLCPALLSRTAILVDFFWSLFFFAGFRRTKG